MDYYELFKITILILVPLSGAFWGMGKYIVHSRAKEIEEKVTHAVKLIEKTNDRIDVCEEQQDNFRILVSVVQHDLAKNYYDKTETREIVSQIGKRFHDIERRIDDGLGKIEKKIDSISIRLDKINDKV